jgi:DASH complex subunit DAD2
MSALESKLATLRDGTEAVACILANWENVLKAISMASTRAAAIDQGHERRNGGREGDGDGQGEGALPVTLVRIPVKNDGTEEGEG